MPDYHNLGKLKETPDGSLKGTMKYPLNRSSNIQISKVTIARIADDKLTDKDVEYGYTHRVFYTEHSAEEDQQYYSEKGGNDQGTSEPPKGDGIPF
ncbi:hypothetical protein [uncultured Mediterranean phage uvMED]|nr:hypothetical protein [uncultured Mediterranean phage uvMED]